MKTDGGAELEARLADAESAIAQARVGACAVCLGYRAAGGLGDGAPFTVSLWTINGAALPIQKLKRKLLSLAVDRVTFEMPLPFDANPVLAVGTACQVRKGGALWFTGIVTKVPAQGSGVAESQRARDQRAVVVSGETGVPPDVEDPDQYDDGRRVAELLAGGYAQYADHPGAGRDRCADGDRRSDHGDIELGDLAMPCADRGGDDRPADDDRGGARRGRRDRDGAGVSAGERACEHHVRGGDQGAPAMASGRGRAGGITARRPRG